MIENTQMELEFSSVQESDIKKLEQQQAARGD
jgi:hypothetical protein